jgi:Group II intron, maturase-specific domain
MGRITGPQSMGTAAPKMNRSAKGGARSSLHYRGEGILIHRPHQGVCGRHGGEEQGVTSGGLAESPGGTGVSEPISGEMRNRTSAVARREERKFLGFSFSRNKEPKRRIAPKVLRRCKQKTRELTRQTRGISLEQMRKELAAYLRGWKSYFGYCPTPWILRNLDYWRRRRLRSMSWKQGKRGAVPGTSTTGRKRGPAGRQRLRFLASGEPSRAGYRFTYGSPGIA